MIPNEICSLSSLYLDVHRSILCIGLISGFMCTLNLIDLKQVYLRDVALFNLPLAISLTLLICNSAKVSGYFNSLS